MKKKEKRYGLLKGILLFILIAIILSWLIPNGQFSATGYQTENTLTRVGLSDLSLLAYYGFYFGLDKIVMLLAIGGLYGVLVKTSAYDRLTSSIASKLNKKAAVIVFSVIIAALTSLLTQSFVVLIFVPFIISILNKMKLDKMTILATTFGSMLVGLIGATYGTEGLTYFSSYLSAESFNPNSTVLIRAGILLVGLVLFNFLTLTHMSKVDKKAESADMFEIEIPEEKNKNKKSSIIPIVIVGVLILVIAILGYTNWSNWSIFTHVDSLTGETVTIFEDFHDTVMDIHVGDFYIFKSILGSTLGAFGTWDILNIASIIFLFTIVIGLCYRIKLNDFVSNFADGVKKMIKPSLVVMAAFALMTIVYMSPYVSHIMNKLLTLTDRFNIVTMSLTAFITNIFHTDLGFTGYIAGTYLATEYVDYLNPLYVIFSTLYGFVQVFIPTSIVLGVGLTSLDVKYSDWLKHIWKFIVGMLIILLVIFILMAVI